MEEQNRKFDEHELLDIILRYLIDQRLLTENEIHSSTIWKNVFPNEKEQIVYFLIKRLIINTDPILEYVCVDDTLGNFDVWLKANDLTEHFLIQQGGFTEDFKTKQKELEEKNRIEKLNIQKLESEVDIIEFQKGLGKRLIIWGFVVSVLSVSASLLIGLISSQSNTDISGRTDALEFRIDSLKNRIIDLEKQGMKEILIQPIKKTPTSDTTIFKNN